MVKSRVVNAGEGERRRVESWKNWKKPRSSSSRSSDSSSAAVVLGGGKKQEKRGADFEVS